jgi:hypothetical protein
MAKSVGAAGRPEPSEAAAYYFRYIDRVSGDDPVVALSQQLWELPASLGEFSEERSLRRYAPDRWSLRQVLCHVNDTERIFAGRALWFARGFDSPLPSFEQDDAVAAADADTVPWASHLREFREIRQASISLFRNLPVDAWSRRGVASDNPFTVRAIAYVIVGHAAHHMAVVGERYS